MDTSRQQSPGRMLFAFGLLAAIGVLLAFTPLGAGCLDGGLNQNERSPGNDDEGIRVGFGEIAVDPRGEYFLSRSADHLVLGDLRTFGTRLLPGIDRPERLAFGYRQRVIYVTSSESQSLLAYDLERSEVRWRGPVQFSEEEQPWVWVGSYPRIQVTHDDRFLVVTYPRRVEVLDAATGDTRFRHYFDRNVVDVDLEPDLQGVLVTLGHEWLGDAVQTRLVAISLADGRGTEIVVPNCADEVVLSPDGHWAFLAPTTCQQDPVSVIDLRERRFLRNLPGFGPVALAPDGSTGVAFVDALNLDPSLFPEDQAVPDDNAGRYHLMLINTETLAFETLALGDDLPRYTITPDGKLILIDSGWLWEDDQVRILDLHTRSLRTVIGPDVWLSEYVVTRDSRKVFALCDGLTEVDVTGARAARVDLEFHPTSINITPTDRYLLLGAGDERIWAYDIFHGDVANRFEAPLLETASR